MCALPKTKTVVKTQNPKNLIIFANPKAGKTTSLAQLPDCLIVDMENGSDFVSGYIVKANTYMDLFNIAKELTKDKDYKFVALDTVTALEDIALELATRRAKEANPNFSGESKDLYNLPYGQGYVYHRNAVKEIISWFEKTGKNLILVGHVKDKSLSEGSTELNVKTLDLGQKLATSLSAGSDAIAYLYRDVETGHLMANFGDMNSVLTGARMPHLAGKTIMLAEKVVKDDGNFDIVAHWENIYPSLKQ